MGRGSGHSAAILVAVTAQEEMCKGNLLPSGLSLPVWRQLLRQARLAHHRPAHHVHDSLLAPWETTAVRTRRGRPRR